MTFPGCLKIALMRKLGSCSKIPSSNNFQCPTTTPDQTMVEVPYDWKTTGYVCSSATVSIKLASALKLTTISGAHLRPAIKPKPSPQPESCITQSNFDSNRVCRSPTAASIARSMNMLPYAKGNRDKDEHIFTCCAR